MTPIFHLITTINRGGAENQLLVLVKEQVKQGFLVHVVFLKGEPELEKDFLSAGAIVHSEIANAFPIIQPFKFAKLIGGPKTIVHAHLPRAELVALLSPKKFRFFASRHNAEPFFPAAPRYISNILSRAVVARSVSTIAISNAVRDYLIEKGEVTKLEKIVVVHYGYESQWVKNGIEKTNHRTGIRLGTISRLSDQKDLPTMFKAFLEYRKNHPSSSLSILGAGPLEVRLRRLTEEMGIEDSVFFRGRSSQVYEFLNELDVFMLTSKYEGFGMVLLEAMDVGIPIVASNNSAIPEVVGNDFPGLCDTGNFKDFSEKLENLNVLSYRKMILEKQEERLKIFESNTMATEIRKIYSL